MRPKNWVRHGFVLAADSCPVAIARLKKGGVLFQACVAGGGSHIANMWEIYTSTLFYHLCLYFDSVVSLCFTTRALCSDDNWDAGRGEREGDVNKRQAKKATS